MSEAFTDLPWLAVLFVVLFPGCALLVDFLGDQR